MSDRDHEELAELLNGREGPAVVSGYRSELYEKLYSGWKREEITTQCASNKKRREAVWIKGLKNAQGELFCDER